MNEKRMMKQYFQHELDRMQDQRMPVVEIVPKSTKQLETIFGYCITAAYLIYYFFGAQWGGIGQYLSFGVKPF